MHNVVWVVDIELTDCMSPLMYYCNSNVQDAFVVSYTTSMAIGFNTAYYLVISPH